jgi:hypothetical protein
MRAAQLRDASFGGTGMFLEEVCHPRIQSTFGSLLPNSVLYTNQMHTCRTLRPDCGGSLES